MRNEAFDRLKNAVKGVTDARRYLDSGNALNWVSDELRYAVLWAIEGWLIAHGDNRGGDWMSQLLRFNEAAPEGLRKKVIRCYSSAVSLEGRTEEEPPPLEQWKRLAYSCLNEVEDIVALIRKNLDDNNKEEIT